MTAPIDVLAVMDHMRDCITAHALDVAQDERWHGILGRHSEARAAVAELISALKLARSHCQLKGEVNARIDAALARVGAP